MLAILPASPPASMRYQDCTSVRKMGLYGSAGYYPSILRVEHPAKQYQETIGGAFEKDADPSRLRFFDRVKGSTPPCLKTSTPPFFSLIRGMNFSGSPRPWVSSSHHRVSPALRLLNYNCNLGGARKCPVFISLPHKKLGPCVLRRQDDCFQITV